MKPRATTADSETSANGNAQATVEDLRALIREAQDALDNVGDTATIEVQALRERLKAVLADGQAALKDLAAAARGKASRADDSIRANPYPSIGIAVGVGLIAGFLLSRSLARPSR